MSAVQPVSAEISACDQMYEGSKEHYFGVGQSAVACIEAALRHRARLADSPDSRPAERARARLASPAWQRFPDAEITACDLDRDGVDFCHRHLGATPVVSLRRFPRTGAGRA